MLDARITLVGLSFFSNECHAFTAAELAVHCKLVHCFSHGIPGPLFGQTLREVYVNYMLHILAGFVSNVCVYLFIVY